MLLLCVLSRGGDPHSLSFGSSAGNLKAKELAAFLEEHALPEGQRDASSSSSDSTEGVGKKQQRRRLFEPEQLQLADLQARISEEEAAWLVAIFGGGHCCFAYLDSPPSSVSLSKKPRCLTSEDLSMHSRTSGRAELR